MKSRKGSAFERRPMARLAYSASSSTLVTSGSPSISRTVRSEHEGCKTAHFVLSKRQPSVRYSRDAQSFWPRPPARPTMML